MLPFSDEPIGPDLSRIVGSVGAVGRVADHNSTTVNKKEEKEVNFKAPC
jgi:hypothetical protein